MFSIQDSTAQSSAAILMIEPTRFEPNVETATDNSFQNVAVDASSELVGCQVRQEFQGFCAALRRAGAEVVNFTDSGQRRTPDSLFPNNWFSTHAGGRMVLYPLRCPNRRRERRSDVVEFLRRAFPAVLDLTRYEEQELYLEGTGSLVLDRVHKKAYYCRSTRTHDRVVNVWCDFFQYKPIGFDAEARPGVPVYHTNVVMSVGSTCAVLCTESVPDGLQRHRLLTELRRDGKAVVEITVSQMAKLCGNVLELQARDGSPLIALSTGALNAFTAKQRGVLERSARLVSAPLDTIEKYGGGGARCMIAELFVDPLKDRARFPSTIRAREELVESANEQ